MRFYEYEAKALFARHGAPLLEGRVARTAVEAKQIAAEVAGPVVLKSQVLTGGRMKAGGVKFADTPAEAEWPPREWREGSRGMGAKSMYRVIGAIAGIMIILTILAFWGMSNG